jgi:hypothetical protein
MPLNQSLVVETQGSLKENYGSKDNQGRGSSRADAAAVRKVGL